MYSIEAETHIRKYIQLIVYISCIGCMNSIKAETHIRKFIQLSIYTAALDTCIA